MEVTGIDDTEDIFGDTDTADQEDQHTSAIISDVFETTEQGNHYIWKDFFKALKKFSALKKIIQQYLKMLGPNLFKRGSDFRSVCNI